LRSSFAFLEKMGKSIRSKIKKRLRTVKRQRVDAMIVGPETQEHYENLKKVIEGRSVTLLKPKNAFKYPNAEGAVFSQHEMFKPIDFRASHLPMAGYAYRGNRRKYTGEQAEYMENLKKSSHPKMQVMAGGGAVLAKTGQRISKREAAILATAAVRPEVAAIAEAGPSNASSAVAAAMAEASASMPAGQSDDEDLDESKPGVTGSDHLRRPVVKDTTKKARQVTGNKPRANQTKKKTAGRK